MQAVTLLLPPLTVLTGVGGSLAQGGVDLRARHG